MTDETLDLTPSPRILDVIADVDMSIEECLAELIDNTLDELAAARRDEPGFEGGVDIDLPYATSATADSVISVTDTGRGMSVDQMRQALRAGSSGNDRYGSLGLFGMGFNVATGRLGYVTTVRSGRREDDHWTIATIDIQAMGSDDSFQVPIAREPKPLGEHGTTISVSRLRSDTVKRLAWTGIASRVKIRLGETYSYLLRDVSGIAGSEIIGGLGLRLYLNGEAIKPYLPCIWSPDRSVPYKGQRVLAASEVNEQLGLAFACMECGHWHSPELLDLEQCVECGSERIDQRAREIRGWLGIQRYDDPNDFGISLIRQGRTIRHLDKGLFEWLNPDTTERFTEYPAELGRGRIVGELHLDHLPVNYRKTDFGRDTVAWRTVVEKVRGIGPLKEQHARQLGYDINTSRLGMLFHAYRRYDPGYRSLVPGNGTTAMAEKARTWARYFRDGLSAYQTDEMWWKYVVSHEEIKAGLAAGHDQEDADIAGLLPDGADGAIDGRGEAPSAEGDEPHSASPAMETRDERLARFRSSGRVIPQLDSAVLVVPDSTTTIKVTAYVTNGVDLLDGPSSANLEAGVVEIFIDSRHPLLADYGWNPVDVAMAVFHDCAADFLNYTGRSGAFLSQVLSQVGDRRLDAATVRTTAEGILDRIRDAASAIVKEDPGRVWMTLSPAAKAETQTAAANVATHADWNSLVDSGDYAEHLSARAVEDLVVEIPERMLDGGVFATTYASWPNEVIRAERLSHVTSLLRDLQRTLSATDRLGAREVLRLSIGLETLDGAIATAAAR